MSDETPIAYPPTLREHVVDSLFGETIADPYRWLENDVREDSRVRDWVEAQNGVTRAVLDALPGRAAIAERLTRLWDYERYGLPERAGNRYFYMRNDGLQNQSTLHMQEGLEGEPRLLIDPNLWSEDGATALAEWKPSRDGRRLVHAVQEGGTDWRTLRVIETDSGETLADEVHWAKFTGLAWARNGAGFFYSRFPEPEEGAAHQQLNLNHAIWFHSVGTPQAADRLVFATPDRPKLNHVAETTDDGRWLVIYSSEGTDDRYEVTLIDLTSPKAARRTLIRGLENNWRLGGADGDSLYFLTNLEAPRQRVVKIDVSTPSRRMTEIVPEDEATLEGATIAGERIVLSYLRDARSEIRLVTLDGEAAGSVALPGLGAAQVQEGEWGEPELFFRFASFATPASIFRLDSATGEVTAFKTPEVSFDPAAFEVRQIFFSSKDGTRVPMFVVGRKDGGEGPRPAILYGYGGFNISITPDYSPAILQWIEMGGVYAVANIRGGGEYGKEWHDGGRLAAKQNSFDDFIAAAEHLIAEGITSAERLAIRGGSNGGLLVGAVVNQRPDLFAAALPAVGVMDMLRFNRFTAGRYWVDDYGDPGRDEDFRLLRAYSPYHNVRSGPDYPAILITTADTDDRVVPGHSFKYAAALQAARIGPKPHLIRIETRAGHGAGTPTFKMIEEYADLWAFAARWTGLRFV